MSTPEYQVTNRMTAQNETIHVGDQRDAKTADGGDLLSLGTRQVFEVANYVFLCTATSVFGIGTNSINIVVFCKQGFQTSTNISFLALAISDLCCLTTLLWFDICMNPLLPNSRFPLSPLEIHSLTGGWPHITFSRITGWITAYITAERCLCITFPLAVKRIITARQTTCTVLVIYLANILTIVPVYATSHFGWKFYPEQNRTRVGLITSSGNAWAESLVFLFHANFTLASVACVIVLTCVLVIRLNQSSKWRHSATSLSLSGAPGSLSTKEKKTTRMVIMISSLLIAMYSPGIILSVVTFFEPKFGIFGSYRNLFMAMWSFGFFFNSINSSVNIFLYYSMSSKYRQTLGQIFTHTLSTADSKPKIYGAEAHRTQPSKQ